MNGQFTPNKSWLRDKGFTSSGTEYEINIDIPYVAIGEFYVQGNEAEDCIRSIHKLWLDHDWTVAEAVSQYQMMYL